MKNARLFEVKRASKIRGLRRWVLLNLQNTELSKIANIAKVRCSATLTAEVRILCAGLREIAAGLARARFL